MASADGFERKDMTFGTRWDAQKMLRLYIYSYIKKKGLNDVANIYTQEANLDLFPFVDSKEGLLKEWWESFWHQFCSRWKNEAKGNSQSLTQMDSQSSKQTALPILPSPKDIPLGNPQNKVILSHMPNEQIFARGGSSVVNITEQPPTIVVETTPMINQRRAGKLPVNDDTDSIPGNSSPQAIQKESAEFSHLNLFPTQLPFDGAHNFPPFQ